MLSTRGIGETPSHPGAMTYRVLHLIVVAFYLAAPLVALVGDAWYSIRTRRGVPSSGFVMTLASFDS